MPLPTVCPLPPEAKGCRRDVTVAVAGANYEATALVLH